MLQVPRHAPVTGPAKPAVSSPLIQSSCRGYSGYPWDIRTRTHGFGDPRARIHACEHPPQIRTRITGRVQIGSCQALGQDDQIRALLTRLVEAEGGRCHCGENTSKVISCYCFVRSMKLTRDVGTRCRDGDRRFGVFG